MYSDRQDIEITVNLFWECVVYAANEPILSS